jgi:predicted lipid-binding transport protein (Tim44 family)
MTEHHAEPAKDAAHAAPAAKKKLTVTQKVWLAVGGVIGVGVGLIVLFTLAGALFTEGLNSSNVAIQNVSTAGIAAMNSLGVGIPGLLRATSTMMSKTINGAIQLLVWPLVAFLIGRLIWNEIKKAKAKDKKDEAHPPAKKDEPKKDEPKKDEAKPK